MDKASYRDADASKKNDINALYRPSKLATAEVTCMSGSRDILYSYVASEKDHRAGRTHLLISFIRYKNVFDGVTATDR